MKPAKSSANRCYHSATTRRSPPRLPGGWHDRSAALGRRGDGRCDARRAQRSVAAFGAGHFHRHAHDRARRSVLRRQGRQPRRSRLRCGRARGGRWACGRRRRQARELSEGCAAAHCRRRARGVARPARTRSRAKIVAVTGSVGKTGTKEALRLTLARNGETHASVASYNNHWGVPLSLARCPESARYAVFELGMNHAGEIEPLTRLVRPQVAIITTVEPVHLEFFGS